jgi:hypothetical protein
VSVGGLLDRQFWNTILRKILSTEEVHRRGAQREEEGQRKCTTEMHREGQHTVSKNKIENKAKRRIKKNKAGEERG